MVKKKKSKKEKRKTVAASEAWGQGLTGMGMKEFSGMMVKFHILLGDGLDK